MAIVESGCNLCVWLVGVFSREWLWLVSGIYGCGYQEMGVVRKYIIIGMVILVGVVVKRYINFLIFIYIISILHLYN